MQMRRVILALSLVCAVSLSAMEGKDLILLRGRLGDVKSAPEAWREPIADFAVWTINDFDVTRPLIGSMGADHFEVELKSSEYPRAESARDIFVLGVKTPAGRLKVIHWAYAFRGLCLSDDVMQRYALTNDITRLRKAGALVWSPDCK